MALIPESYKLESDRRLSGIDISRWQENIDWQLVKNANLDFVIIRAGYGSENDQVDALFHSHMKGAESIGLNKGVYWYSYALSEADAKREAEVCFETVKNYDLQYPIMFDIEDTSQMDLSSDTISSIIDTFCGTIESLGGHSCVYSFTSFLNNKVSDEILDKYDIWIANVDVSEPSYAKRYVGWQYSWSGNISGISGNVDCDYCYYDYPSFLGSGESGTTPLPDSVSSDTDAGVDIKGYFCHPLKANYKIPYSSYVGHGESSFDFACSEGTAVYSMSAGTVSVEQNDTEGNAVHVLAQTDFTTDQPLYFRYLHLSQINVNNGDTVKCGQLIGLSGNTGDSTGAHLHIDLLTSESNASSNAAILPKSSFKSNAVQGYLIPPADYSGDQHNIDYTSSEGAYMRAIFAQKLEKVIINNNSDSASGDGGVLIVPNDKTSLDTNFREYYFNWAYTEDFMGKEPINCLSANQELSVDLINECPTIFCAYFGMHEFGCGSQGEFSYASNTPEYNTALMTAKLFRATAMDAQGKDSLWENSVGRNGTIWNSYQDWIGTDNNRGAIFSYSPVSQDFIDYCELVYKNIRYPSIYGITDSSDVETGNSRYYAIAAGYTDNLSLSYFDGNVEYYFKEKLPSFGYAELGRYYYVNTTGTRSFRDMSDCMNEWTPSSSLNRLPENIDELNGMTKSQVESYWNIDLNSAGWCANFAWQCLAHSTLSSYADSYKSDSSSVFLSNLVNAGLSYFAKKVCYAEGKKITPDQLSLSNVQSGDVIFFDFDGDAQSSNSSRAWEHTGIIREVNGNALTIVEGNVSSKVSTNSVYTISGNELNGPNNSVCFVIVHLP